MNYKKVNVPILKGPSILCSVDSQPELEFLSNGSAQRADDGVILEDISSGSSIR